MSRHYHIGEWVWDREEESWVPPRGAVGLVDLRADDGSGVGFFATEERLSDGYAYLGDSLHREMLDAREWERALGVAPRGTLLDALWDVLTVDADATGAARARPITPTHRGALELHLGGHSLVRSRKFTGEDDPAWPVLRTLYRGCHARVQADATADADAMAARGESAAAVRKARELPMRYLSTLVAKLGIPAGQIVAGAETRRPETTIRDDFNRTDRDLDGDTASYGGVAQGFSWSVGAGSYEITAEQAMSGTGNNNWASIGTLSGDDSYVQSKLTRIGTAGNPDAGAGCRGNVVGNSHYRTYLQSITNIRIDVRVEGTLSLLADVAYVYDGPHVTRVEADGSTIRGYLDGGLVGTHTDTSLPSGLYGIMTNYRRRSYHDDFEAGDLAAAPLGPFANPFATPFQAGAYR